MSSSFLRAWMRLAVSLPVLAAPLWAGASSSALTTVVTPLTDAVTYSSAATTTRPALSTFLGYTVSITNTGSRTVRRIKFEGEARATDKNERVLVTSIEGAMCKIEDAGKEVECEFAALLPGASLPTFTVFLSAPVKDTLTPLPDGVAGSCATTDCVFFRGETSYGEDRGPKGEAYWAAAPVTLGTASPTRVKTAVPKTGGSLFTGSGAISLGTDKFTTAITVPSGLTYTTAEIQESDETTTTANCLVNLNTCFRSNITVPGTFAPYLTIVLRQDSSTIVPGTYISNVQIEYTGTSGTILVGMCSSPTTPRTDGLPCIAKRVHYSNPYVPGWTPDLNGDFEWTLISTSNGSYKVF